MVESRVVVFQDVKTMSEHEVDINVISIIGPGQGTEAKTVKRVLSWSLADFTWKANPKHARDLIAWAGLEQPKAAAPSPGTAATTNQDIAKPKVRTEARLKRVARYLLGEPEVIWTFLYQEMPTKVVVRTDAN